MVHALRKNFKVGHTIIKAKTTVSYLGCALDNNPSGGAIGQKHYLKTKLLARRATALLDSVMQKYLCNTTLTMLPPFGTAILLIH